MRLAKTYIGLLGQFTELMRVRFMHKAGQHWSGWDKDYDMSRARTIQRINDNLMNDKENGEVDAANLCLMLWNLRMKEEAQCKDN